LYGGLKTSMGHAEVLGVEVVFSAQAGHLDLVALRLGAGAVVSDALAASGLLALHGLQADQIHVGIWGKVKDLATPLRDRDRVEIYRPLQVDPKEARRQRYRKDKPPRMARRA